MSAEWVEAVIELGDRHRNLLGPTPRFGPRGRVGADGRAIFRTISD